LDENHAIRDIVTVDELAELIPSPKIAAYESPQEEPPVDVKNRLLEQAVKFWEQSTHDLQKEVRELRDYIDRLERQNKNEKPRSISVIAEPVSEPEPEQAPPEKLLSRKDRHKSHRIRWF
jgi:TolA-binding protein